MLCVGSAGPASWSRGGRGRCWVGVMEGLGEAGMAVFRVLSVGLAMQRYPDGDPDALRDLGSAWGDVSNLLADMVNEMNSSVSQLGENWGGASGQAFQKRWQDFMGADGALGELM